MTPLLYNQKVVLFVLLFFVPFRQHTLLQGRKVLFFTSSYSTTTTRIRMTLSKATPSQLRRAAGSCKPSALETFKQASRGWTVDELNQMGQRQQQEGQCDGKNLLHMAAWQGSLEILQYLVDEMKCDVNVISRAKFSYGKTAIFFACTRGRNEHVQFLLQRGASVLIINNKGQSPLSLASSHLDPQVILEIQQAEQHQLDVLKCTWVNYRATHSDGLDYGDQDPRFYTERPLGPTDNVTELAINPTTRQLRKGILFRLNPHIQKKQNKQPRRRRNKTKRVPNSLSPEQEKELQQAWSRLLLQSSMSTIHGDGGGGPDHGNPLTMTTTDKADVASSSSLLHSSSPEDDLITILQISDQQQFPWLPTAADRLVEHFQARPDLELECLLESAINKIKGGGSSSSSSSNSRLEKLLEKFTTFCLQARQGTCIAIPSSRDNTRKDRDHDVNINNNESEETVSDLGSHQSNGEEERDTSAVRSTSKWNSDQNDLAWMLSSNEYRWKDACQVVKDLTIFDCFEGSTSCPILALPSTPTWIHSVADLSDLEQQILQHHVQLVAIDSEWWCPPTSIMTSESNCSDRSKLAGGPQVATLQLAVCHSDGQQRQAIQLEDEHNESPELVISSWVIDLLYKDEEYQTKCKAVVRALFQCKLLLGFAVKQDIHKLNHWLQDTVQQGDVNKNTFDMICMSGILDVQQLCAGRGQKHQLPGLAACVSRFAKKPLCKRQQCSNWGQRPLTAQQLEYAGLDAAILLPLVAEIYRQALKQSQLH